MRFEKRILGAFCYWSGIDLLFYWLNRKAKRVGTFHNVLPDELCRGMRTLPVAQTVSSFRRMIREATRYLKTDADLDASGTLTITFDDGYLNQYEVAPQALAAEGVGAAVIFVSDDALRASDAKTALTADRQLHQGLDYTPEYARLRLRGMSPAQMEELRSHGWKIGYHTKTHRRLSEMSAAEQRMELKPPSWLKDNILSYPFGWEKDVDDSAVQIAADFGYDCAFSNQCERSRRISRHFRPRMVLMPDKYWIHFELSGAKFFFKYRRLLPRV